MKILWITKKYFDIEVNTAPNIEVTKELLSFGHDVRLLGIFGKSKSTTDFGLNTHFTHIRSRFDRYKIVSHFYKLLCILLYTYYQILIWRPHVVITNYQLVVILLPIRLLNSIGMLHTKCIMDVRTFPNETNSVRERILSSQFDLVMRFSNIVVDGMTLITPAMRDMVTKKYSLKAEAIGIWTSGVNTALFSRNSVNKLPKYERLLNNKMVLLFHGALSEKRGIERVIRAIKLLEPEYCDKIIFLILSFGPLKAAYDQLVDTLSLHKMVVIKDVVPYELVPSYISMADVGIMPYENIAYWTTSSPIKLLEYLAMEKPVIVSDIRSHRDILGSAPFAFYLPDNKTKTIAVSIENVYNLRHTLERRGRHGRCIIEKRYTWSRCAKELDKYLKRTCGMSG